MPQTFSNSLFLFKNIILLSLSESRAKEPTEHYLNRLCLKKQCEVTTGAFLPSLERSLSAPDLLSYVLVISGSQISLGPPQRWKTGMLRLSHEASPGAPYSSSADLRSAPPRSPAGCWCCLSPHLSWQKTDGERERVRKGVTGLI